MIVDGVDEGIRLVTCQACGAGFVGREDGGFRVTLVVLGTLGLAFASVGIGLAGVIRATGWVSGFGMLGILEASVLCWNAAAPWWHRVRCPAVAGAPVPPIRFPGGQPARRCPCGGVATCVRATPSVVRGLYSGATYAFACRDCGRAFTTASPYAQIEWAFIGGLALACGLGFGAHGGVPWPYVVGPIAVALGIGVDQTWKLTRRFVHPVVGPVDPAETLVTRPAGG
ncbi:MAG: hypothetical protein ABMB14_17060 [Myxococcota bacterium]